MSQRKRKARKSKINVNNLPPHLRHINLNAAGIDIGSDRHLVAVPEGSDDVSVRQFGAFTSDLHEIADWLEKCGVTTVAMESTGVYWIPLFEVLEQRGFEVKLVDARHVKNVSGRKSDVLDCQWLQQLHTYGLLQGAFRPPDEVCVLRSYVRQKEMLTQASSMHIQHMQKALQQMNLLLHNVLSDITGVTGMKIIKAILAGERDPSVLALNRDKGCRNSKETIANPLWATFEMTICLLSSKPSNCMRPTRARLPSANKSLSIIWESSRMSLIISRQTPVSYTHLTLPTTPYV